MHVCEATLGHRLPFCCYSSLFRAGPEERGICVAKIRALNERFPGLKNTAPEFVPLNSFSCLCAPGSSLFTEHRNGSDKRLWMHFWNEVSTAGFPLVWQRLTAQLLHVKTTQEVPCREGQIYIYIYINKDITMNKPSGTDLPLITILLYFP